MANGKTIYLDTKSKLQYSFATTSSESKRRKKNPLIYTDEALEEFNKIPLDKQAYISGIIKSKLLLQSNNNEPLRKATIEDIEYGLFKLKKKEETKKLRMEYKKKKKSRK